MRHAGIRLGVVLGLAAGHLAAQTMAPWLTRSADNARDGWNPQETTLTQAAVTAKGIQRFTIIPVMGDARGMEAQPLVLPGVKMADSSTHDVLVLPSMADVVRGVDAHTGAGLWQVTLGTPVMGSAQIDFHQINQHWGCLSTGVIDPATQRLYQVCWVSKDGSGTPASGRYEMFVLNVATGALVVPPVPVQGTDASMWKQRSSLVLLNQSGVKTVLFAHGSVYETGGGDNGFTGGITAFDVATNKVSAQLPISAGIWQAGQGLACDAANFCYAITGNGDFDPSRNWYGESFLKVQYTPASAPAAAALKIAAASLKITAAVLKIVDAWSPWTDFQRSGQATVPAGKIAGQSLPSHALKAPVGGGMSMPLKNAKLVANINAQGQPVVLVYPVMASGAWSDEDWGSGGPACMFSIGVCVATGKDGIAYPIKTASLGGTTAATVGTAANYAKLAAPCAWLTVDPGPVPCAPADPATLNFFPWGDTAHLHMTPVQFYDPVLGSWTIFAWGENAQLHKWAVSATGALTYVAEGHEVASADARGNPPGGMPGGFCSGSSNGPSNGTAPNSASSAILVCTIPYGDANAAVVNGRLLVYDPVHLAEDGSLKVLWDSQRWGVQFLYNKFDPPVIDGGLIYVPNYNGGVDVYRLTQ